MLHIVLYEPEIPPNTGNLIRLSANTGFKLHLIEPLGFSLDEKHLRRAGLDYHDLSEVYSYPNLQAFWDKIAPNRSFMITTKGQTRYSDIRYQENDALIFGPETRGLPTDVLSQTRPENWLRIPMKSGNRSLNLSNSAAILVFEAWRQWGFIGGR